MSFLGIGEPGLAFASCSDRSGDVDRALSSEGDVVSARLAASASFFADGLIDAAAAGLCWPNGGDRWDDSVT